MDDGEVQVDSVLAISLADITPQLARESGFKGVVDLLKVAKHGRSENVYLVRFHYLPAGDEPGVPRMRAGRRAARSAAASARRRRTE
jgi:hypothetical protein